MSRHERTLSDLIRYNAMIARRDAERRQRRADAAHRAEHPDQWADITEPGLECLGREWRRKAAE